MYAIDETSLTREHARLTDELPGLTVELARALSVAASGGIAQDADANWLVPSASRPGAAHVVTHDGRRCDCTGYAFAPKGRRWCRHTLAVRLILAVERAEYRTENRRQNPAKTVLGTVDR